MKNLIKYIFSFLTIIFVSHSQAFEPVQRYTTFTEYENSMKTNHLPITLIIGCGHGIEYTDGDHSHPNCWCVNMKTDPMRATIPGNTAESFKELVQYDEILDISKRQRPFENRTTGEFLSFIDNLPIDAPIGELTRKILDYRNKFDAIVFERAWSKNLQNPWTLWNAVHMLKIGGELIIDSTVGYNSTLYTQTTFYKPETNQPYPVNKDIHKLEKFGISSGIRFMINPDMIGIADYLSGWHLTNIINVIEAYQPYTKKIDSSLKTARMTRILSATKTVETDAAMERWAKHIQTVQGLKPIRLNIIPNIVLTESGILPIPVATDKSGGSVYDKQNEPDLFARVTYIIEKRNQLKTGTKLPDTSNYSHKKQGHGEHTILLRENIERNREAMEWIFQELRWRRETETSDFWSLQAIKNAYKKVSEYSKVATSPLRKPIYAENDEVACKNANIYMKEELYEYLGDDLKKQLASKGFDWK